MNRLPVEPRFIPVPLADTQKRTDLLEVLAEASTHLSASFDRKACLDPGDPIFWAWRRAVKALTEHDQKTYGVSW